MPTCSTAAPQWKKIKVKPSDTYAWDDNSTYVKNPPYFAGMSEKPRALTDIKKRAHPRRVRRFHHHRPHQPGGFDQEGFARPANT